MRNLIALVALLISSTSFATATYYTNGKAGATGATGTSGGAGTNGATGATGASPWLLNGNNTYYTAGKVGIGTTAPSASLTISGNVSSSAWTTNGIGLSIDSPTYTDTSSSGTVALTAANAIGSPTIAASSATTYTDSTNLYIAGSPAAGTNVTQTRAWGTYSLGPSLIGIGLSGSSLSNYTNPSTLSNALYVEKINTGTGTNQVLNIYSTFDGASNSANRQNALLATSATSAASTGNLTATTIGGGLENRYDIVHGGTGTVSLASAVAGRLLTNGSQNSPITTAASFFAVTPIINSSSTWGSVIGLNVEGGSVSGTITNRYGVKIDDLIGGTTRYGVYQAGSSDKNYFAGNTGIGTTAPAQTLDVYGATNSISSIRAGSVGNALNYYTTSTPQTISAGIRNDLSVANSYAIYDESAGQPLATLLRTGNLGLLNVTNPESPLQIQVAGRAYTLNATTNTAIWGKTANSSATGYIGFNGSVGDTLGTNTTADAFVIDNASNFNVEIATNNTLRLKVDNGGQVMVSTVGKGLSVAEGSNAKMGTGTCNGTTAVTISTTAVTASSRIFLTEQTTGLGIIFVDARTAGTSFNVKCTATDTSTFAWIIFEPSS